MGATIRYMKKIRSDGDASMCAIGTSMPRLKKTVRNVKKTK